MEAHRAILTLGDDLTVEVADEHQLTTLLAGLCKLGDGQVAALRRGPSDFIEARRHEEHWSVSARRGRMWTAQSFTAQMTSDYSERRVREGREHRSLSQRFIWWLRSPSPERALSTEQVSTVFAEYLSGREFTLPISGAAG